MKYTWMAFSFGVFLSFCSCSEEDEPISQDEPMSQKENFYMNFTLGDSSFVISSETYQLGARGALLSCAEEYVRGYREPSLEAPDGSNFIQSINFTLSRFVLKEALDLSDDSGYMHEVLHADRYGFPIRQEGHFTVFDPENDLFMIDWEAGTEAYLWMYTNEEQVYRSTSVVPNQRDENSFLVIDKVTEVKDSSVSEYDYIVEGRFKVNLFKGFYGTDSEIAEGDFRWPIVKISNSELLNLCD